MTVWAPWPYLVDRRLVVNEHRRNVDACGDKRVANVIYVHAESSEHLTGQSFDVKHAEQNVPGGHLWFLLFAREPTCPFESPPCPGRERQKHFRTVRQFTAGSQRFDHLVARSGETHAGRSQHLSRLAVIVR